ncbi:MAG: MFS transporter [bacterium]|nr:MFS transporter [bacterium]
MPRFLGESGRAWAALGVGVLAVSAHSASSLAVSVLMKSIVADFGWQRADFAWAMTGRILAITVMMPVAGKLADAVGARVVLAGGALLVGTCVALASLVTEHWQFVAVNVAMGPGQACIGSVAASALVLRLFERHRGVAIGVLNGGDNLVNSMVPFAAASLLGIGGWRFSLRGLAVAYVLLAVLIALTLRREDGRTAPAAGRPDEPMPWKDARLWAVCLTYALIYAFITSLQLHFHAFQTDGGRSMAEASRLLSIQILVGAIGAPLFGWIAERTSARTALCWNVGGLVLSALGIWTLRSPDAVVAWAVFHGIVNSGVVAVLALVLHEIFGPRRIGEIIGVAMVFCMGATLIGNQWTAFEFDRAGSYLPVWQTYTGVMVLALAPAWWLWLAGRPRGVSAGPSAP